MGSDGDGVYRHEVHDGLLHLPMITGLLRGKRDPRAPDSSVAQSSLFLLTRRFTANRGTPGILSAAMIACDSVEGCAALIEANTCDAATLVTL
jgi:hypothetical protein